MLWLCFRNVVPEGGIVTSESTSTSDGGIFDSKVYYRLMQYAVH